MPDKTDKSLITALTADLATKTAEVDRLGGTFKADEEGRFEIPAEQARDYRAAVAAVREVKGLLDDAQFAGATRDHLNTPATQPATGQHFAAEQRGDEVKSLADVFLDSPAYDRIKGGGFRDNPFARATLEGKSIFSLSGGSVTHQALGTASSLGIAEGVKRKMHIRDLFPKASTRASILYGVRETGWTNNAAQVHQRYAANGTSAPAGNDTDVYGLKPKSKITLVPVTYPVAIIAHTLDAHTAILDDEPRLRSFLNTRMVDGVKYAEDSVLLQGVGSGEDITGLFNVTGVQTYTGLDTDGYSVQVRRAITKALLAEYEPNGLILSPTMWEAVEVEEGTDGHFRVATSVAVGSQKQVWRLNVVETTAIPDANFVVGNFGLACQLYDREQVNVVASTENKDNLERNVVTLRAEERIAFEIPRPEAIVIGTWTAPAAPAP